jgi:hypothetical protein
VYSKDPGGVALPLKTSMHIVLALLDNKVTINKRRAQREFCSFTHLVLCRELSERYADPYRDEEALMSIGAGACVHVPVGVGGGRCEGSVVGVGGMVEQREAKE